MNVLFFISNLEIGGAQKQIVLDANMLCSKHSIAVVFFRDGALSKLLDPRVKRIHLARESYLKVAKKLSLIIRRDKISVVNTTLYSAMIIGSLTRLFTKVKVYWHFHSHEYELPGIHRFLYQIIGKTFLVTRIVFVSNELKNFYVQRFGYSLSKCFVLYNSSNMQTYVNRDPYANKIIIGYIGRLVELKRVQLLLDLAVKLKNKIENFEIVIIGDGPERKHLEEQLEKLSLQLFIVFEGFQTNVENYYSRMNIFILPSREECLSIALIDAGMSGVPAIAFNVGGNAEIIKDGETGFIVDDSETLYNRVYQLITDLTLRKRMSENSRNYCQEHFSEKAHMQALQKLILE